MIIRGVDASGNLVIDTVGEQAPEVNDIVFNQIRNPLGQIRRSAYVVQERAFEDRGGESLVACLLVSPAQVPTWIDDEAFYP